MHFIPLVYLVAISATLVNAHFQLQYPQPRGPFNEDDEPNFCDGYTTVAQSRISFPLKNGVIKLVSEHPSWTVGVLVSILQDPKSFNDFKTQDNPPMDQLAFPYFQNSGAGNFCIPFSFPSNITGVGDGANVTIQVVFDGGDGKLFQCADLTLSNSASIPSDANSGCTQTKAASISASLSLAPSYIGGWLALIGAAIALYLFE